jgi:RyR domain-containing protein
VTARFDPVGYRPRPIDTSGVDLPPPVEELLEKLAANAHDVWAAGRLAEGWTHGKTRDDVALTHPCLVHYSELPESEKEYDRRVVRDTLRAAIALGYELRQRAVDSEQAE